jgi:zinc transport system ATP-binding protein
MSFQVYQKLYNTEIEFDKNLGRSASSFGMPSVLSLQAATVGFDRRPVLTEISVAINQGQWVCLFGPNGSGKTTLLRTLLGALPLIAGKRTCTAKRIGYVPQHFPLPLDSPLSAREFLCLKGSCDASFLKDLGVETLLEKQLRHLSGGQLRRVMLVFALLGDPEILFLDEYREGLDLESLKKLTGFLEVLHRKGLTIIEVSHDLSSVVHDTDRVIMLQGSILFDGSPKDHGFHECLHTLYDQHQWIRHDH